MRLLRILILVLLPFLNTAWKKLRPSNKASIFTACLLSVIAPLSYADAIDQPSTRDILAKAVQQFRNRAKLLG